MVGSGPGGLLYPYVVRGYRKSTSPAQEELLGHRRGRLGRQVVGLPPEPTELRAGDRRVDPFHRRLEIETPPGWLQEWSGQIGAALKDGLRETPGWIAFARENGTVYHTYTVTAPDPFVAPYYSFLLERTAKAQPTEPRSWRKDEYPE